MADQVDLSKLSVSDALVALNKKYGEGSFVLASKARGTRVVYTSTGIYELDYALGGGLPQNRIIEFHGRPSSYKSTVLLLSMASFQRQNPKGLAGYVDLERTFDGQYAAALGVDLSRLVLIDANTGELAVDQVRDVMELNVPLMLGIDSLAAMRPTKELEAEAAEQQMALHPRLVGRAMGYINARLKRSIVNPSVKPVTVIILNQLRATMDQYNPEVTPGGKAKDFFYSVIIRFSATNPNEVSVKMTRNGITKKVRVSQLVKFTVKKNKTCGPQNEEGEFMFWEKPHEGHERYSVDNFDAMVRRALFYEVIKVIKDEYIYGSIRQKSLKVFKQKLALLPEEKLDALHWAVLDAIAEFNKSDETVKIEDTKEEEEEK